jgi:hypothetical protein
MSPSSGKIVRRERWIAGDGSDKRCCIGPTIPEKSEFDQLTNFFAACPESACYNLLACPARTGNLTSDRNHYAQT